MGQNALSGLTNDQLQVILTGVFGDGCLSAPVPGKARHYRYSTNCIHEEYIKYKASLLGDLAGSINTGMNMGYKKAPIYRVYSKSSPYISEIANNSLETNLNLLDDLGLALWFYDDGSLHKRSSYYNLCTHAFSKEDHENIIIPFLEKRLNIKVSLAKETKKDGRVFYYCRISKMTGAYIISSLLSKFPVECYKYKIFSEKITDEKFVVKSTKFRLSPQQNRVRGILRQYPNERILGNGALTGNSGIIFDTRTIKALERKGVTLEGKLVSKHQKKQ